MAESDTICKQCGSEAQPEQLPTKCWINDIEFQITTEWMLCECERKWRTILQDNEAHMKMREAYLKKFEKPEWATDCTIRPDRYYMVEDICMHGTGHPNKDWLKSKFNVANDSGAHGCCGCCHVINLFETKN